MKLFTFTFFVMLVDTRKGATHWGEIKGARVIWLLTEKKKMKFWNLTRVAHFTWTVIPFDLYSAWRHWEKYVTKVWNKEENRQTNKWASSNRVPVRKHYSVTGSAYIWNNECKYVILKQHLGGRVKRQQRLWMDTCHRRDVDDQPLSSGSKMEGRHPLHHPIPFYLIITLNLNVSVFTF